MLEISKINDGTYFITYDTCLKLLKRSKSNSFGSLLDAIREKSEQTTLMEQIIEVKKMEVMYKLSDNYRLQLESDLDKKKIQCLEAEKRVLEIKINCLRENLKGNNEL